MGRWPKWTRVLLPRLVDGMQSTASASHSRSSDDRELSQTVNDYLQPDGTDEQVRLVSIT